MFKEGMLALVGQGFLETLYMTVISTAFSSLMRAFGLMVSLALMASGMMAVVCTSPSVKPHTTKVACFLLPALRRVPL